MSEIGIVDEILRLKREKGAVILAHYYQVLEIQDLADFVGDSLKLSLDAMKVKAKRIIFCGVDFMAEQAAILNPDTPVFIPEIQARCPMAHMLSTDDILRARKKYPNAPVILYVNSLAEHKALADYIVTSSSALPLVEALPHDTIIFGPDRNLADYVAEKTGKEVIPIPENGFCPTHMMFTPEDARRMKELGYKIIVHPECTREVRNLAEFVGSTKQLYEYIKNSDYDKFAVGTEVGLIERARRDMPDKKIVPLNEKAICINMKKITLKKLYLSLKHDRYKILVDPKIAKKVRFVLEKTFDLLGLK